MSPEDQAQVQAAIGFLKVQLDRALNDGMNAASKCEELAQANKAKDAEIEELKKPKEPSA